jgi:hypothetical protein
MLPRDSFHECCTGGVPEQDAAIVDVFMTARLLHRGHATFPASSIWRVISNTHPHSSHLYSQISIACVQISKTKTVVVQKSVFLRQPRLQAIQKYPDARSPMVRQAHHDKQQSLP